MVRRGCKAVFYLHIGTSVQFGSARDFGATPNLSVNARADFSSISRKRCYLSFFIAARVVLHPVPGVGDHGLQGRLLRRPAELSLDLLAGRDEYRRVPGAARGCDSLDGTAGAAPGRLDDLPDGESGAVAEVVDAVLSGLRFAGGLQRQEVRASQILDVDVVADGGAVGGRVVGAEDFHGFSLPEGGLEDQRDQVRLRLVILT